MPKVNVYLPDDLAAAVRRAGVPVSAVCQAALAEAVRAAEGAREVVEALRDPGSDVPPDAGERLAGRMTPRLREALSLARAAAGPRGGVDPEHLLTGLIDQGDNLALRLLELVGVDGDDLRGAVAPRRGRARGRAPRADDGDPLGRLSPEGRLAMADAVVGATGLGHAYLGCEHLLLGLAGRVEALAERGVTPDRVRRAIPAAVATAALGYRTGAARSLAPPAEARLDDVARRLEALERRVRAGGL